MAMAFLFGWMGCHSTLAGRISHRNSQAEVSGLVDDLIKFSSIKPLEQNYQAMSA
jgi:hypothetical protein